MNRSAFTALLRKDLLQYRWFMLLGTLCGLISLMLIRLGPGDGVKTGVNIGFLLYISSVIALSMFIVMFGILREWQEKSALFLLSLPISPSHYFAAKLCAAMLAFVLPWLLLGATAVALTLASRSAPDGAIPGLVAMMCFFLAHFAVVLSAVLVTRTERWAIALVVLTNVAMPVLLSMLFALPGMTEHARSNALIWSDSVRWIVVLSLMVSVLTPILAMAVLMRKKTLF